MYVARLLCHSCAGRRRACRVSEEAAGCALGCRSNAEGGCGGDAAQQCFICYGKLDRMRANCARFIPSLCLHTCELSQLGCALQMMHDFKDAGVEVCSTIMYTAHNVRHNSVTGDYCGCTYGASRPLLWGSAKSSLCIPCSCARRMQSSWYCLTLGNGSKTNETSFLRTPDMLKSFQTSCQGAE
jgi:hypothetical protein